VDKQHRVQVPIRTGGYNSLMDTDFTLVLRYQVAKLTCSIGQWFVERGIDIAGEGTIDIWFETSVSKPLPTWLTYSLSALGLVLFWAFIVILFATTGD